MGRANLAPSHLQGTGSQRRWACRPRWQLQERGQERARCLPEPQEPGERDQEPGLPRVSARRPRARGRARCARRPRAGPSPAVDLRGHPRSASRSGRSPVVRRSNVRVSPSGRRGAPSRAPGGRSLPGWRRSGAWPSQDCRDRLHSVAESTRDRFGPREDRRLSDEREIPVTTPLLGEAVVGHGS